MSGGFVVLEGIEGAGKSTQVRLLDEWLTARAIAHVVTREPGGTEVGEAARRALLEGTDVPVRSELLLILAARAALVEQTVRPALEAGKLVVADRYELSTFAYQIGGRGLNGGEVRALNAFATGGLKPSVTIVLDLPLEAGLARRRAAGTVADRIEQAGDEFHRRVAEAYRLLSRREPGVVLVDGAGAAEVVQSEIRMLLASRFPETFARATG